MSQSQSAILPEAGPFALYALFRIKSAGPLVLSELKKLSSRVEQLNQVQPGAALTLSIAFTRQGWQHFEQPMPEELEDFRQIGEGDAIAPCTAIDFLLHCHSTRHDLLFYLLRKFMSKVSDDVELVDETYGFRYLDARDMTGFIDGTENPKDEQRAQVAVIADGPLAGGSYVLVQRYVHNLPAWNRLNVSAQEKVFGRTKSDSIELENVPPASHVGRVDIKEHGKGLKIVRHSLPYGKVGGDHGLLFLAYCNTLHNFKVMLSNMYGETDGKTDHMLRFTQPVTGAYLFAPSVELLEALSISA